MMEMGNNIKYIVYLTTNIVNNKIYVGVHKIDSDKFDGYIGCGANINNPTSYKYGKTHFHSAILKYGINAFHRHTIAEFDNLDDALRLEQQIVNSDFCKRTDTYNMVIGGGFPPNPSVKVYEFDLNGKLQQEYESISDATKKYGYNKDRISTSIKLKKNINDKLFSFSNTIDVSTYNIKLKPKYCCYNENLELLFIFDSLSEASSKLDISKQSISNGLYDRTKTFGYYFLYDNEDVSLILNKRNNCTVQQRPVYMYDLNGVFLKEYKTLSDACKENGCHHSSIIRAIKNGKICAGYKWSYINSKQLTLEGEQNQISVKIEQYDLNGKLIKIWDSVCECKKQFPCCQKVCRGERRQTKGYTFKYVKDIV